MKTLRESERDIEYWVAVLNGYLQAISEMNSHIAGSHGFWTDLIYLEGLNPISAIKQYLKNSQAEVSEIDLRIEKEIIEEFVYRNFIQDVEQKTSRGIGIMLEQFRWHIQEFISLSAKHSIEKSRWLHRSDTEDQSIALIFIHVKEHLVVLNFKWTSRPDSM